MALTSAAQQVLAGNTVDWFALIVQLPGGLALFLYGMKLLGEHIKLAAGVQLQQLLLTLSGSKMLSFLAGLFVTALTSSLSLVSVLLVQFVASDLVTFEASLPVLFGAGVGSTFISVLQVLSVTKYGMLLISVGFFSKICMRSRPSADIKPAEAVSPATSEIDDEEHGSVNMNSPAPPSTAGTSRLHHVCTTVFALGVIFIGMETMSDSFKWARTSPTFLTHLSTQLMQ